MKQHFQFNHNGVCQNPQVIPLAVEQCGFRVWAFIKIAQSKSGKWAYGHELQIKNSGSSRNPNTHDDFYKDQNAAVVAALNFLSKIIQIDTDDAEYQEGYLRVQVAIDRFRANTTVPALFDYTNI